MTFRLSRTAERSEVQECMQGQRARNLLRIDYLHYATEARSKPLSIGVVKIATCNPLFFNS